MCFGDKGQQDWRKLHSEELHRLFSRNFVNVISSKGWAVQRVSKIWEGREF